VLGDAANAALRTAILAAAGSPWVRRFVDRHGMRLGAGRFVGGETLDEVVPVLRGLNERGFRTNTTLLGEHTGSRAEAAAAAAAFERILGRIAAERLVTNVAVKLTHLGLALGEDVAHANAERVVRHAAALGSFVRLDMEESRWVDPTLRIYRRLRESGLDNVGVVLQSYLHRSERDLEALLPLQPNVRLVKGAYLEPPQVAFPRKEDVDAAYVRLMERALGRTAFTAVATHDEAMIERAIAMADQRGLTNEDYELQMLYGVRQRLQAELIARGRRVLVATPFGPDWFPYLMRRLAERPANLLFFLRGALR
jgi:proline dehydrogenase